MRLYDTSWMNEDPGYPCVDGQSHDFAMDRWSGELVCSKCNESIELDDMEDC